MRPRFFVGATGVGRPSDPEAWVGRELTLGAGDAHHARRVLRSRAGDPCELVLEPGGALLGARFIAVGDAVVVKVESLLPLPRPDRARIALVQGVPELRKMDEVVEKGTEVGVDRFLVVRACGSPGIRVERLEERADRWRRIAREAAKQSRQLRVPLVGVAPSVEVAVGVLAEEAWESVVLDPLAPASLGEVLEQVQGSTARADGGPAVGAEETPDAGTARPPLRVALWVGPEPGWSEPERGVFEGAGMRSATLGWRVLRTETAGPVVAAVCRFALGDW